MQNCKISSTFKSRLTRHSFEIIKKSIQIRSQDQKTIMPKICCKLHRLLDSKNESSHIKKEKFEEFCKFIQESWIKRKTTIQYDNPNDINIFLYLFAGAGTHYLSGMAGQYITFQPGKNIKQAIKRYPVLTTKQMPETKSLSFIGETTLPNGLLLLLSYEKSYLNHHIHYNIQFHMIVPIQIQCLLFILSTSFDTDLLTMITERLTCITMCDDNPLINIFETPNESESIAKREKITINNFFPDYLCINCKDPIRNDQSEIPLEDSWSTAISSVLMLHNWTKISKPSSNPHKPATTTNKRISVTSLPYYGKVINSNSDNNPIDNISTRPTTSGTIGSSRSSFESNSIDRPTSTSATVGSHDLSTISPFTFDESFSFSTNRFPESSNSNRTNDSTTSISPIESISPSTLSDLNITMTKEKRSILENPYCCNNDAIAKKLISLPYTEFMNQKQQYCAILKNISIKSELTRMYFYLMDSSIHVKTNSVIAQINNLKKIQYVISEGYKNSLLFCDYMLTPQNFIYFPLLSQPQLVTLQTIANLSMNHLTTNRLPLYMSLNQTNESKFVRTFLKLADYELHYNSIKHRIPSIIRHNNSCILLKK